jgi:hypothetical protein
MNFKKVTHDWSGAEGAAILPTVCSKEDLRPYHPMAPSVETPYRVKLSHLRDNSGAEVPGKFLLHLFKYTGWDSNAMGHVNYKGDTGKTLIFEYGDTAGNFLFAVPPNGAEMKFDTFSLKRWEIHKELDPIDGRRVFVDYLIWQPNQSNQTVLRQEFVTSWRWINDN